MTDHFSVPLAPMMRIVKTSLPKGSSVSLALRSLTPLLALPRCCCCPLVALLPPLLPLTLVRLRSVSYGLLSALSAWQRAEGVLREGCRSV